MEPHRALKNVTSDFLHTALEILGGSSIVLFLLETEMWSSFLVLLSLFPLVTVEDVERNGEVSLHHKGWKSST